MIQYVPHTTRIIGFSDSALRIMFSQIFETENQQQQWPSQHANKCSDRNNFEKIMQKPYTVNVTHVIIMIR